MAGHSPIGVRGANELLVGTAAAIGLDTLSDKEVDAAVSGGTSRLTMSPPLLQGMASDPIPGRWSHRTP